MIEIHEVWVVCAGNPGRVPYYAGTRKPLCVCWEDALKFPTKREALEYLEKFGCAGGWSAYVIRAG